MSKQACRPRNSSTKPSLTIQIYFAISLHRSAPSHSHATCMDQVLVFDAFLLLRSAILILVTCSTAIPYNTGSHLKYFIKGREVYDEYYGYMLRCSSIWDLRHKPIMWAKMVHFPRTADSDRTAEWWRKHWQGPWTLGDC
jgi:hypothetical protein